MIMTPGMSIVCFCVAIIVNIKNNANLIYCHTKNQQTSKAVNLTSAIYTVEFLIIYIFIFAFAYHAMHRT